MIVFNNDKISTGKKNKNPRNNSIENLNLKNYK